MSRMAKTPTRGWSRVLMGTRDNRERRASPRVGLQNRAEWFADDAVRLLHGKPGRVLGRPGPPGDTSRGRERRTLRDHAGGWSEQLWRRVQNHLKRHADDDIQLLLPQRVRGRR